MVQKEVSEVAVQRERAVQLQKTCEQLRHQHSPAAVSSYRVSDVNLCSVRSLCAIAWCVCVCELCVCGRVSGYVQALWQCPLLVLSDCGPQMVCVCVCVCVVVCLGTYRPSGNVHF